MRSSSETADAPLRARCCHGLAARRPRAAEADAGDRLSEHDRIVPALLDEFRRGLAEMGFVEGQNLRIEYRMAAGDYERLPALVAELVRMSVDVIVAAGGSHLGDGGEGRNHKIPIVVISGEDPVKLGLAQSLARPGGNLTGVSQLVVAADAKRLELLHELV